MADWEAVRADLVLNKQEHLLQFLPELSEAEKAELYADICDVNFAKVQHYFDKAQASISNCEEKKDELLQPLDSSICGSTARDVAKAKLWEQRGEK